MEEQPGQRKFSVAAAAALRTARPRLGLAAAATGLVAAAGDDAGNEHPNEQTAQNQSHADNTYEVGRGFMGASMSTAIDLL